MFKSRKQILLQLVSIALFAILAAAQAGTSRLSGAVTDANGALIGGATVTATNEATGVVMTQGDPVCD